MSKTIELKQELLLAHKEIEKLKLVIFGLLKDKQKHIKIKG